MNMWEQSQETNFILGSIILSNQTCTFLSFCALQLRGITCFRQPKNNFKHIFGKRFQKIGPFTSFDSDVHLLGKILNFCFVFQCDSCFFKCQYDTIHRIVTKSRTQNGQNCLRYFFYHYQNHSGRFSGETLTTRQYLNQRQSQCPRFLLCSIPQTAKQMKQIVSGASTDLIGSKLTVNSVQLVIFVSYMNMWDRKQRNPSHLRIHNSHQPNLHFFEICAINLGE